MARVERMTENHAYLKANTCGSPFDPRGAYLLKTVQHFAILHLILWLDKDVNKVN